MRKPPTEEQRAQAKARREKFRGIVQTIAKMTPEQRLALSQRCPIATVEGRALSVHNQCLIASQRATATIVGGFRQWKQQGRSVKRGEHGLMIWVPCMPGQSASADTPQPEEMEGNAPSKPRFLMGTVFDVAQTCELGERLNESEVA
jgi:antirestriction protein ArdC